MRLAGWGFRLFMIKFFQMEIVIAHANDEFHSFRVK